MLHFDPVQVYASYKYRRDLVEAAKVPGLLGRSRMLHTFEAHAQVRASCVRSGVHLSLHSTEAHASMNVL